MVTILCVVGSVMAQAGVVVTGNVYGGGNNADVQTNTAVNISGGDVRGNVYGGGNLGDVGTIDKSDKTNHNYTWKQSNGSTANVPEHNKNATAANTGICTVSITGGTIGVDSPADATRQGNVFGAGRGLEDTWWCEKAIAYATSVSVSGGMVKGNVYGGGQIGRVEDDAKVVIGVAEATGDATPTITGSVFGAGAGLVTHGYSALVRGNAAVTVQGTAQVGGSVYGGGETASVGRFTVVGGLPKHPDSGGYCTVTIQDNAQIGSSGTGHNVYGACKGVTPAYVAEGENRSKSMQLRTNAPNDDNLWSYYNNDESSPFIWRYYATEADYEAFLRTLALTSHPTVTIAERATVYGSVYGGGERGLALGNVAVNITGGSVEQDVYGGGALANSNAGNWDADGYAEATVTAGETLVTGMYTRSGAGTDADPYVYTEIKTANTKAAEGTTYYRKGKWADATKMTANYTTTVDLTGGTVKGDAYGGGLGQKNGFNGASEDIAAVVWGDIHVNLGSSGGSTATAFNISNYGAEGHTDVVKSGRVFGCNNLLGSPQGNVTVTVWKTVEGNTPRTADYPENSGLANKTDDVSHTYEVAAVYGGGNLANYTTAGKKANVIIETCDVSIESVYGGGNAAEVPETDVLVKGAYEIGTVFGGGNGNDPYTTDGGTNWVENPGANVNGNANTLLTGGYIHEAYGGSNRRGTITGNVTIDVGTDGACTLDVGKVVAAGKNADVNGNLIVIMGCKPSEKVPLLFAGADDANVYGNVELTITSGNFGKVFGGNNNGGCIYGHIKLNIEETGDCDTPITIDELYLGGNQAAYSVYGYKTEDGKQVPRSADELRTAIANDNPGKTEEELAALFNSAKQEDPELNIISCTYIGQAFGGGYGTGAYMYADPKVNINMIQGSKHSGVRTFMTTDPRVKDLGLSSSDNPNSLGVIGTVYGGGNAADVYGDPTVNIGTLSKVQLHESLKEDGVTYNMSGEKDVLGAYIAGNVFGGGKGVADVYRCPKGMIGIDGDGVAHPDGGTTVNIINGFINGSVYGGGEVGRVEKNTVVNIGTGEGVVPPGTATSAPVIKGNVFGAGKGENTHGYAALVRGNTTVSVMGNAKVMKSVYGGGEIASVGRYTVAQTTAEATEHDVEIGEPYSLANANSGNCIVTVGGYAEIGPDDMQMKAAGGPDDTGYVFGAGKGVLPYEGYAENENPWRKTLGTSMTDDTDDGTENYGAANEDDYLKYIGTLALAIQTDVTIKDYAFIKGSVYGGSENGHVQHDTDVKIQDYCQIGNGDGVNSRYAEDAFIDPTTTTVTTENALAECASWPYGKLNATTGKTEYLPYDKYDSADGDDHASDGHTFYGNVFGGGSGLYPYKKPGGGYEWLRSAGRVYGNTSVEITGGHILTSVYGGCELTDVGDGRSLEEGKGTCKVKMSGGTLGVPRTLEQIAAHPVTCYLFGAGKGDQRTRFNQWTNVGNVIVEINDSISRPIIYGSVFGGGEDGHVLGDVHLNVKSMNGRDPVIGTWGTSYVEGNVFGGGRGFGGDALTAGVVSGNVNVYIQGGKMLGSIYGGGRLGSVGTYLVPPTLTDGTTTHPNYGQLIPDGEKVTVDWANHTVSTTDTGGKHGRVSISISGGTIGNDREYKYYTASIDTEGKTVTQIDAARDAALATLKAADFIPNTDFEAADSTQEGTTRTYHFRLKHTKGGNVFAGAMGRLYELDNATVLPHWPHLGKVKSTKLTITGGTVKSNVYGGGELGWTEGTHSATIGDEGKKDVSTEISINGGTIGTEVKDGEATKYTFGSVFGGGYGSSIEKLMVGSKETNPKFQAGRVKYSTKVDISGGTVLASVYGGGEVASVGYGFQSYHTDNVIGEAELASADEAANTYVSISGDAVIGKAKDETNNIYYGGATMGNVYGGGSGNRTIVRCGLILGNTNVKVSGGTIYHNIYGGGAYGSVGNFIYTTNTDPDFGTKKVYGVESLHTTGTGTANVTITGGTIGIDGRENGMVFGSSRGDVIGNLQRDDYMAWVNEANVTIGTSGATTGPTIAGSVYGSGENGHTLHNTNVAIHSGTIGILTGSTITGSSGKKYNGAEYPYRGNVYGGGCGTDTYTEGGKTLYNPLAGIVMGNATVTMDGGRVARTIYGGGAMGSVGTFTYADATYNAEHSDVPVGKPYACQDGTVEGQEETGLCTVSISGGTVGPDALAMPHNYGMVFGAGRGEVHDPTEYTNLETSGYVNKTLVTISGTAFVKGSVYGGAESGHVLADTHVKIQGGQIGCGYDGSEGGAGDLNRVYTDAEWAYDVTTDNTKFLYECPSWPYKTPYTPYDKFADEDGMYSDKSSADNAHPTGTDGHTFYGNVFGGGSGYEPYAAGKWLPTAGWVEGNTTVEITGGHILTSVYGGNEMTDVGQGGVRKMTDLANETPDMFYDITKPGGKCTVKMSGGTLGVPRTLAQIAAHPVTCYLFGAGKGDQRIFFNKITNVKEVDVEISGSARIYGSVFGGGEDGHVMRDVKMTIKDNAKIGTWGTSYVEGNVFGGGRGFSGEALTAGNVGGCVNIDIQGGTMLGSVYGGGRLGSVGHGLYLVDEVLNGENPYGILRPDNQDDRGRTVAGFERGNITINISGGTIGNDIEYAYIAPDADAAAVIAAKVNMPNTQFDYQNRVLYTKGGNVFAGCMGRLYALDGKLLPLWPELGRCKNTVLNITGGHIKSNVYGGAELGVVQENTKVSITGGIIGTTVGDNAYVYGSAFGGGKGSNDAITYPDNTSEANKVPISEAGTVHGNVVVELNNGVAADKKGGIVNKIFGCNDTNGTPKGTVTVHVYATQTPNKGNVSTKQGKDKGKYDVEAVYGGGNLAAYNPDEADSKAAVIIDGCELTSIETVYGGGNAASVPATEVTVNGTYEIGQAFGGGNGMDKLPTGEDNPGANVGYYAYANESEKASKAYGTGKAHVTVLGGTVHEVYGGSNTKGNVREESKATLVDADDNDCPFDVTDAYGGGRNALQDGDAILDIGCITGLGKAYGGASNADVNGDVVLSITNGTYGQVFGGNDMGGCIRGSITVNIEETGCRPVIIGELYGGGNQAAYSVYGYDADDKPLKAGDEGAYATPKASPVVNVRSFSSIGRIFGGGYGEKATMVGDPTVNINVLKGRYEDDDRTVIGDNARVVDSHVETDATAAGYATGFPIPSHKKNTIGAIQDVFGGGNAAEVIGTPHVEIGTKVGDNVVFVTPETKTVTTGEGESAVTTEESTTDAERTHKVEGVDIRGNVFGGGNNAVVTGNTDVVIGAKKP